MKQIRKITAALLAVLMTVSLLGAYVPRVHAENAQEDCAGDAEATEFEEVVTSEAYYAGTGDVNVAGKTPVDVNAFIAAMLDKCGKGYSQADRYSENYYDCSSLVQRCLKDLGITKNVPAATYYWDELLKDSQVGDVMTFYGPNAFIKFRLTAKNIPEEGNEAYLRKPGTIMIFIAPGLSAGHICVSLGEFARQDAGLDPVQDRTAIIENTKAYVAAQLESRYGVPASRFLNKGAVSGVCPTWLDDTLLGTDMTTDTGAQSGPYCSIFRVEAFKPEIGVCVDNTNHGTNWNKIMRYVLEPIESEAVDYAAPAIEDVIVSDVTSESFRVMVKFNAEAGVRQVQLPTWTEKNGQDDIVWHTASVIDDNTAVLTIHTSDHKYETGTYITHIYVTDMLGKQVIQGITTSVPEKTEDPEEGKLEITYTEVADVSPYGYTVIAAFNAPKGVKEIVMPTWTEKNGQDDIVWHKASSSDGKSVVLYIKTSDHKNESGTYITHIYVRDNAGGEVVAGVKADIPVDEPEEPEQPEEFSIVNAEATEISSSGYRVTVEFTAPKGVKEVLMPTWTEMNGQDDLIWHQAAVSGNTATFYVKSSDHKNETGDYMTHVYVYDTAGSFVAEAVSVTVPEKAQPSNKLMIADAAVTELTSDGYRVTAVFNAPDGVQEVLMPTWTDKSGQDDLVWHKAQVVGNAATFYVKISDHKNESGLYITHIYVKDKKGKQVIAGVSAEVPGKETPPPVEPDEPDEPDEPEEPGTTPTPAGVYVYNGLDYAPVFNPEYYLAKYTDLKKAFGTNAKAAFNHFIQCGIKEGRQAIATFSVTAYRARYADLRNAFGNNLQLYVQHYLTNGIKENRVGY